MRASGITANEKIMQNKYVEVFKREEYLVSVQERKKKKKVVKLQQKNHLNSLLIKGRWIFP